MSQKRAFLIIGPEGSGTKLLTRMFIDAGCQGDSSHDQAFDRIDPIDDLIVIRRSYPHSGKWPDLEDLRNRLSDYEIRIIVIIRGYRCTVASRTRRQKKPKRARRLALEAFKTIGADLFNSSLPFIWVTYEALVSRPKIETKYLFDWAGLETPEIGYIFDGNGRYD